MTYNVPAAETWSTQYSHINGSAEEVLARVCIQELCKGWPVYRDFSEWKNYRDLFTDDAAVFTTWSGGLPIDTFISVSQKGRAAGDFIAHRENGTLAEVNLRTNRGLGKMKATITQRFVMQGVAVDVECDCRFIFFCKRAAEGERVGQWRAQWVKLFYEKDKVVPVDGRTLPVGVFEEEVLKRYTEGYRYLAAAQATLGHPILDDLPNCNNEGFFRMYEVMQEWMQGKEVDLFWEKK